MDCGADKIGTRGSAGDFLVWRELLQRVYSALVLFLSMYRIRPL